MKRLLLVFLLAALVIAGTCTNLVLAQTEQDDIINIGNGDTGDLVVLIQTRLRDLGYFLFQPTGRFQSMTANAAIAFQKNQMSTDGTQFITDGRIGEQSMEVLFSSKAVRAPIAPAVHIPIGPNADGTQTRVGTLMPWSEVSQKLNQGRSYTLIDFNTGTSFSMTFTGGENHAEVECTSALDTQTYKTLYGDTFSYFKRPMLLELDGQVIACSLQGQPHGTDSVSGNDMSGHACLFFEGSVSHVGRVVDVEHINHIYKAAGRN